MIFNQTSLLNHVVKNSDKAGRISLACYSENTSKKEKIILLEQYNGSKRLKIVRCYARLHSNTCTLMILIDYPRSQTKNNPHR